MDLKITPLDTSAFVESAGKVFVSMNAKSKLVQLTCTKVSVNQGFLFISINNEIINVNCGQHLTGFNTTGFYCIFKRIELDLGNSTYNSIKEFFDIKCILQANSNLTISKPIYKLCKFNKIFMSI